MLANLGSVLKSRDITLPTKVCIVKAMVFPVVMYGCECGTDRKEGRVPKTSELWFWKRLYWLLWAARRSNQSILREKNPEYSLEGVKLKLKHQYFGHLMQTETQWKSPWCWERLRAEGKEGIRGWGDWTASLMQWTWTWANSGRRWETGRPSVLRSMGSQHVGHDWATEQHNDLNKHLCKEVTQTVIIHTLKSVIEKIYR